MIGTGLYSKKHLQVVSRNLRLRKDNIRLHRKADYYSKRLHRSEGALNPRGLLEYIEKNSTYRRRFEEKEPRTDYWDRVVGHLGRRTLIFDALVKNGIRSPDHYFNNFGKTVAKMYDHASTQIHSFYEKYPHREIFLDRSAFLSPRHLNILVAISEGLDRRTCIVDSSNQTKKPGRPRSEGFVGLSPPVHLQENRIPDGFSWDEVKAVILAKFTQIAKARESEQSIASLSPIPNVHNYTLADSYDFVTGCLNRLHYAPFTLGRICQLLLEPKKHYDRGDKFLRAFEKCVAVTSTSPSMAAEMNGVEINKMQNGDHSVGTTENGVTKMDTDNVTNGTTNGHVELDAVATKHVPDTKLEENAVSSSVESTPSTEQTNEEQNVGSSTDETKPVEPVAEPTGTSNEAEVVGGGAAEMPKVDGTVTESDSRTEAPKRQLEEKDTVAKKIGRRENGTADAAVNGSSEEPVKEPKVKTMGNN